MIEIRPLRKVDDFGDLIELSRLFFSEYEPHHPVFFKIDQLKDEAVVSYFSSFCDQESQKAFIARDRSRIVGYITVYIKDQADYWQVKRLGEISGFMVQKEYRHQGIATRLLAAAKLFFKQKGLRYYAVYTATANHGALEFYRKNGLLPLYTTMLGEIELTAGQR